jgi:hypothetical protein
MTAPVELVFAAERLIALRSQGILTELEFEAALARTRDRRG